MRVIAVSTDPTRLSGIDSLEISGERPQPAPSAPWGLQNSGRANPVGVWSYWTAILPCPWLTLPPAPEALITPWPEMTNISPSSEDCSALLATTAVQVTWLLGLCRELLFQRQRDKPRELDKTPALIIMFGSKSYGSQWQIQTGTQNSLDFGYPPGFLLLQKRSPYFLNPDSQFMHSDKQMSTLFTIWCVRGRKIASPAAGIPATLRLFLISSGHWAFHLRMVLRDHPLFI